MTATLCLLYALHVLTSHYVVLGFGSMREGVRTVVIVDAPV